MPDEHISEWIEQQLENGGCTLRPADDAGRWKTVTVSPSRAIDRPPLVLPADARFPKAARRQAERFRKLAQKREQLACEICLLTGDGAAGGPDGLPLLRHSTVIWESGCSAFAAGTAKFQPISVGRLGFASVRLHFPARRGGGHYLPSNDGIRRAMAAAADLAGRALSVPLPQTAKRSFRLLAEHVGVDSKLPSDALLKLFSRYFAARQTDELKAQTENRVTVSSVSGVTFEDTEVQLSFSLLPGYGKSFVVSVVEPFCRQRDATFSGLIVRKGFESAAARLPENLFLPGASGAEETGLLPVFSPGISEERDGPAGSPGAVDRFAARYALYGSL